MRYNTNRKIHIRGGVGLSPHLPHYNPEITTEANSKPPSATLSQKMHHCPRLRTRRSKATCGEWHNHWLTLSSIVLPSVTTD